MSKNFKSTVLGVGAFGLAPFIISIASILAVPIMISQLGSALWLSIAVGQAAGELARAVTIWGWNSVGLARVSAMTDHERTKYYLESIPPRLVLFTICTLILIGSAFIVPVTSAVSYGLVAVAGALLGLSGAWAFIGAREPKLLILIDSLPRALTIGLAALLLLFIPQPEIFGILTLAGNLIAVTLPVIIYKKRQSTSELDIEKTSFGGIRKQIRSGFSAFTIGFVMTARMSLPVLLSPSLIPAYADVIALADKFLRWGNTAITPVMQYVQTGIPRISGTLGHKARKGTRLAIIIGCGLAALSSIATLLIAPLVSDQQIHLPPLVCIQVGLVLGLVFVSSVTGNSTLVILGKTGTVAKGATFGLIAMGLLIIPMSLTFKAVGMMLAYLVAETGIITFQMLLLRKTLKFISTEGSNLE